MRAEKENERETSARGAACVGSRSLHGGRSTFSWKVDSAWVEAPDVLCKPGVEPTPMSGSRRVFLSC